MGMAFVGLLCGGGFWLSVAVSGPSLALVKTLTLA